jgi:hypothetical protein
MKDTVRGQVERLELKPAKMGKEEELTHHLL